MAADWPRDHLSRFADAHIIDVLLQIHPTIPVYGALSESLLISKRAAHDHCDILKVIDWF